MRRGNGLALVDATRPNLACKASALGRAWSKQRLSERYGDFVPGPEIAEVARGQLNAYVERAARARYETMSSGASIRMRLVPHGLGVRSYAMRCLRRSMRPERHIGGISSCGITRLPPCPFLGRTNANSTSCSRFERKAAERKLGVKIKGWRKAGVEAGPGSWKEFLGARAARGDQRALRRLTRQSRGPAIKSDDNHLRALPPRSARTSRGSIVHNLPGGIRLRESAGSIELLGDPRDDALEQLVTVAQQRFGTKRVTLLGTKDAQKRLAELAAERGLEIAEERQR